MTLPNIPMLEEFLTTLRLEPQGDKTIWNSEIIVNKGETTGLDRQGKAVAENEPEIRLWYKNVDSFTLESLISVISAQLKRKGHIVNKQIILSIIGLYINLRQPRQDVKQFLDEIISSIVKASASLIYVFPKFEPIGHVFIKSFTLGPYAMGELNTTQVKRLCKSAKSDYYERYEANLRRRLSIWREYPEVNVINWYPYREKRLIAFDLVPSIGQAFNILIENYYAQLHFALFASFFNDLLEEQHLPIAAGANYLDEQILRSLPRTETITIFQNTDGKHSNGFVTPHHIAGLILDLAGVDTSIPKTIESMKADFNLTKLTTVEVHQTLKTFALFMSKAKRHKWKGNLAEAFLHFIIALDLLFGEANQSTASVSQRASAITYQPAKRSFKEQTKRIRELYAARSKYVHEGRSVDKEVLVEAEFICDKTLKCLLHLQRVPDNRSQIKIETWLKNIDIITALLEAEKQPNEELFVECGIILQ